MPENLKKIADIFECPGCLGGLQVANDPQHTPWLVVLELPLKACPDVISGAIRPITCPQCNGSGELRRPVTA